MTYKPKISHDTALLDVSSGDHHAKTGDNEVYGLVLVDLAANRPAAGISGRWFIASDTLAISYDDGAAWNTVGTLGGEDVSDYSTHKGTSDAHHAKTTSSDIDHANISNVLADQHHTKTGDNEVYGLIQCDTIANRPAAGIAGRFYWATDEYILYRDDGASWYKAAVADHPDLDTVGTDDHHAQDHKSRHASGGADAIAAGDLNAGADPRSSSHVTRHESGGADAITLGNLADMGAVAVILDTAANRPAAGTADRIFVETDTGKVLRDNGASWDVMGTTKIADTDHVAGNHESGGSLEISVAGLSGVLADTQPTWNVVSKSANYTASGDDCVLADASGGAITITLPSPSLGAKVHIIKIDTSANAVTVGRNGTENIAGSASDVDLTAQNDHMYLISDGTDWFVKATSVYL